jgi:hypothetical protein
MNEFPSHQRASILRDATAIETDATRSPARRLRVGIMVLVETQNGDIFNPTYALPGGGTITVSQAWRLCQRNGWARPEVVDDK